ncbi:MAG: glycerophosphodiester phosphodiesterase family protein [Rhodothermales bacterium]|nr:glycerophosphodiester phosphodiesterase family protein [Rhodothermales bacterium]
MTRTTGRLIIVALLFAGISACSSSSITSVPAPYLAEPDNYVYFENGADLSDYLRFDRECGPLVSAHRGGPIPGFPENAIETFRQSVRTGPVFLEVDVRFTVDSVLVLLHDETLDRTTNGSGYIDETSFEAVRALHLRDQNGVLTPFQIPTLSEALAWSKGRAVVTLDVKRDVHPEHVVATIREHNAEGFVIIIVYSTDDYRTYQNIAPDLVYSVSFESSDELREFLFEWDSLQNVIAWTGVGYPDADIVDLVHQNNALAMAGTFGDLDSLALEDPSIYGNFLMMGIDVIATDQVQLASHVVNRERRNSVPKCSGLAR